MTIEDTLFKAEKTIDDYLWREMRAGRKDIGCGCRSCNLRAINLYQTFMPNESMYIEFEQLPEWIFDNQIRADYASGKFTPPDDDIIKQYNDCYDQLFPDENNQEDDNYDQ